MNFGPAHYLRISGRLRNEFKQANPKQGTLFQRIGWDFPLYRLNIPQYKYRGGQFKPLMDLAEQTANSVLFPAYDFSVLISNLMDFLNGRKEFKYLADEGKIFLKGLEGFPVPSHSAIYRGLYSPCYIIVRIKNLKIIFNSLSLK